MTFVGFGQRGDGRGLVGRAAPGHLPVTLPAPVDVVDLDLTGELALGIAFEYDLQELVLEAPGGVVGHPELALDLSSAEMAFFCWARRYKARNQIVSGSLLWPNTVPAVSEAWCRQCLRCSRPRVWILV
jgi:hypothetical protein